MLWTLSLWSLGTFSFFKRFGDLGQLAFVISRHIC